MENGLIPSKIAWVKCPKCGMEVSKLKEDYGLCWDCTAARDLERDRAKAKRDQMLAVLGEEGYQDHTFERLTQTPGNKAQIEFCKAFDPATDNLYLWGVTGAGKDHLSHAIARKYLELGRFVIVKNGPALFEQIYAMDFYQRRDEVERMARADVLVIHDIGKGGLKEFRAEKLYEIIEQRKGRKKNGMIWNSNLSPSQLAVKIGDTAISSRIVQICKIIECEPVDWRLK